MSGATSTGMLGQSPDATVAGRREASGGTHPQTYDQATYTSPISSLRSVQMTDYNPEYHPDLDRLVWGAKQIAPIINRNERQTFYLLEQRHLDADKVGGIWVSSPRRLLFGKRKVAAGAADHRARTGADA